MAGSMGVDLQRLQIFAGIDRLQSFQHLLQQSSLAPFVSGVKKSHRTHVCGFSLHLNFHVGDVDFLLGPAAEERLS